MGMSFALGPETVRLGRWHYTAPELSTDGRGNTVFLVEAAFGPAESVEWGLDARGQPYRHHTYGEDSFYAETTELHPITMDELRGRLEYTARLMRDSGHPDFGARLEQSLLRIR